MSDKITLYPHNPTANEDSRGNQRKLAVEAALEIVRSAVQGGLKTNLVYEFENLGTYADQVQEALKPKQKG